MRDDWDSVKLNIMKNAIHAKFTQNSKLTKLLIDTYPCHIIEDSPTDNIWGGEGNLLGKILIELREELK